MNDRNQWLIEYSEDDSLWVSNFQYVPDMIVSEYHMLRDMAAEGRVYGIMLRMKDVYEGLMKIPVILSLVIIDSKDEVMDTDAYKTLMRKVLERPLAMGTWNEIAGIIIKHSSTLCIPDALVDVLDATKLLYHKDVADTVPDVIKWRNSSIGHGSLRFEDDEDYKKEIKGLLENLKTYFDGDEDFSIVDYYKEISIHKDEKGELLLTIEGADYTFSHFSGEQSYAEYLYDSFFPNNHLTKYLSLEDGRENLTKDYHLAKLYDKYVASASAEGVVNTRLVSREEEKLLACIHAPIDYIRQTGLIKRLEEEMKCLPKGVITISMERGTGKSTFANRMSGLYHSSLLNKRWFARTYHLSNGAIKGNKDFFDSINFGFRHSYNSGRDIVAGEGNLPSLSEESQNPAKDMAEFLNYYHDYYFEKEGKRYTILVLDGIDEMKEENQEILKYIPSSEDLDDGVFVVLTTRFETENTVKGYSKKAIVKVNELADSVINIKRKDKENIDVLKHYLIKHMEGLEADTNDQTVTDPVKIAKIDALIKKADYRFLYLKPYVDMRVSVDLDSQNETAFIKSYMDYVLSFYGEASKRKLKELAVSIALFKGITLSEYQEYLNCPELTYEFIGLLNDLLPVLTVLHDEGEDSYEFADAAYCEYVLHEYKEAVKDVIDFYFKSMDGHLVTEEHESTIPGIIGPLTSYKASDVTMAFYIQSMVSLYQQTEEEENVKEAFFSHDGLVSLYLYSSRRIWDNRSYQDILVPRIRDLFITCMKKGLTFEDLYYERWINLIDLETYAQKDYTLMHVCQYELSELLIENIHQLKEPSRWYWLLKKSMCKEVALKLLEIGKFEEYYEQSIRDWVTGIEFDEDEDVPTHIKFERDNDEKKFVASIIDIDLYQYDMKEYLRREILKLKEIILMYFPGVSLKTPSLEGIALQKKEQAEVIEVDFYKNDEDQLEEDAVNGKDQDTETSSGEDAPVIPIQKGRKSFTLPVSSFSSMNLSYRELKEQEYDVVVKDYLPNPLNDDIYHHYCRVFRPVRSRSFLGDSPRAIFKIIDEMSGNTDVVDKKEEEYYEMLLSIANENRLSEFFDQTKNMHLGLQLGFFICQMIDQPLRISNDSYDLSIEMVDGVENINQPSVTNQLMDLMICYAPIIKDDMEVRTKKLSEWIELLDGLDQLKYSENVIAAKKVIYGELLCGLVYDKDAYVKLLKEYAETIAYMPSWKSEYEENSIFLGASARKALEEGRKEDAKKLLYDGRRLIYYEPDIVWILRELMRIGEKDKAISMVNELEDTILLIDERSGKNISRNSVNMDIGDGNALSEQRSKTWDSVREALMIEDIKKACEFLLFLDDYQINFSLTDYLMKNTDKVKESTCAKVSNIGMQTNFEKLHTDIALDVKVFYAAKKYKDGNLFMDQIEEIYREILDNTTDEVLKEIIREDLKAIEIFKTFFSRKLGEEKTYALGKEASIRCLDKGAYGILFDTDSYLKREMDTDPVNTSINTVFLSPLIESGMFSDAYPRIFSDVIKLIVKDILES